jgi:hypothetical protein
MTNCNPVDSPLQVRNSDIKLDMYKPKDED